MALMVAPQISARSGSEQSPSVLCSQRIQVEANVEAEAQSTVY